MNMHAASVLAIERLRHECGVEAVSPNNLFDHIAEECADIGHFEGGEVL